MPSKSTFTISPIKALLEEEMDSGLWIDCFAGSNSPAEITNDLNPEMPTTYHLDALDFLRRFGDESIDGVLYDPPYSLRQVKECYDAVGLHIPFEGRNEFWTKQKEEIARMVKPGGKVICCGWNSVGIGKTRGFELIRILLVPHGGWHNDTIVTVERKLIGRLDSLLNGLKLREKRGENSGAVRTQESARRGWCEDQVEVTVKASAKAVERGIR